MVTNFAYKLQHYPISSFHRAAETIDNCLIQILKYIEDVQSGKVPSNGKVGRLLMETVSRVPKIDNTRFEAMLNSTMQVSILYNIELVLYVHVCVGSVCKCDL